MSKNNIFLDKAVQELPYPLSLSEGLSSLTKQQLTNIGKRLSISGLSSLNKSALADKLAATMPDHLAELFQLWDIHRLRLIQKAVKNDGRITNLSPELEYYEYFQTRGMLFPTYINEKIAFVMPEELVKWCKEAGVMGSGHDIVKRNAEWIQLTLGLLYHYGTLTLEQLQELVFKYADHRIGARDYTDVLLDAMDYYLEIESDEDFNLFSYYAVEDPEEIMQEQAFRAQVEFFPFTKQQLIKAGEPDYIEKTKLSQDLVNYLATFHRMDRLNAELLVEECVIDLKNGAVFSEAVKAFTEWIEFSSMTEVQPLMDRIVQLSNNTKQWALKGYSPNELSEARGRKPATVSHIPSSSGRADVISFETKKKVGRNDPCPCESGVKFKKCCGK